MRWFMLCLISSVLLLESQIQASEFIPLGDLPGGSFRSDAFAVSADGNTVVGFSINESYLEPVQWTEETGLVGLGNLPGEIINRSAYAVSSNGNIIVGSIYNGPNGNEAFQWTEETGMVGLGFLPGSFNHSTAFAISNDGTVVTGTSSIIPILGAQNAFRWTEETGMLSLGTLPGGARSIGHGISGDGRVIVGGSDSPLGFEPFRWTEEAGMVGLGLLPGNNSLYASAASADGSVIVGGSSHFESEVAEAFRWTTESGIVGLGILPGRSSSHATAVSADGNIIIGTSNTNGRGITSFIWDQFNGMRDLEDVLIDDYRLNISGWRLAFAEGISADGTVIVGHGLNPAGDQEGWIVRLETLPGPPTLNGDGATLREDFDSMGTNTASTLPKGWSVIDSAGSNHTVDSLGLADGPLDTFGRSVEGIVNVGGGNRNFHSGDLEHLPTWKFDYDKSGLLDEGDVIIEAFSDRALGIARTDEDDPGSLTAHIEISDSPLRALVVDWDLEVWGGDPESTFRGSDGGGFAAELTVGDTVYYNQTVSHKPGDLFYTEFDGAPPDSHDASLIDGNKHAIRNITSGIVEVDAADGVVGNLVRITFDADKGWIPAVDNVQFRALAAGDAQGDGDIDPADLIQLLVGGAFDQGNIDATWEQGDFDNDGDFDGTDILAILSALNGQFPREFVVEAGVRGDGIPDLIINPDTGRVAVDTDGLEIFGFVIDSAAGIFNGPNSPSWDNPSDFGADIDTQISMPFTMTVTSYMGIDELGEHIIGDWPDDFDYLADLTVIYHDGNEILDGNLRIVPEPSSILLAIFGLVGISCYQLKRHANSS